jgi:hypothetical protein
METNTDSTYLATMYCLPVTTGVSLAVRFTFKWVNKLKLVSGANYYYYYIMYLILFRCLIYILLLFAFHRRLAVWQTL